MATPNRFIGKRLSSFRPTTFWQDVRVLVEEYKPVDLGRGFPDWAPPSFMIEAANKAMTELNLNQYTAMFGYPPLMNEIALEYSNKLNSQIDSQKEVLVSVGALGGLFCAFQAFLNPGEEVLVFEPFFNIYEAQIQLTGAKFVGIPLHYSTTGSSASDSFSIDFDELESLITDKTKMILYNSPHNPTGKVFSRYEIQCLCDIVKKYDLLMISDEAYSAMILGSLPHLHPASFPDMYERTITIGSAGKSFSITGWKIGWCVGPSSLIGAMKSIHLMMAASIHCPAQYAITKGFQVANTTNYYSELCNTLRFNQDRITQAFRSVGLRPIDSDGAYVMVVDFERLQLPKSSSLYEEGSATDWKICVELISKHKIAALPLSAFCSTYKDNQSTLLRVCFCKNEETMNCAVERIKALYPFVKQNQ